MSTEYRRNIPSVVHVEAATRLGLLWHRRGRDAEHRTRFVVENGQVLSDYGEEGDPLLALAPVTNNERHHAYYCIRPDGTPVDWEVLDQEVARVGQQGQSGQSPLSQQPEGFRADLFRRIASRFDLVIRDAVGDFVARIVSVRGLVDVNAVGVHANDYQWGWATTSTPVPSSVRADILARWTVYQELKPLYDLVDGAQGEAAMPRDVAEGLQAPYFRDTSFVVNGRDNSGRVCLHVRDENNHTYSPSTLGLWRLANFAAVLDAIAERRVAERMRRQAQAPTVTSAQPEQHRHDWIYDGLGGGHNGQYVHNCACGERDWFAEPMSAPSPREAVVRPTPAQPQPRRFADVRPDRHGWRWWRIQGPGIANTAQIECSNHLGEVERQFRFRGRGFEPWTTFILDRWLDRTVIPTDEQGNPVSWETIAPTGMVQGAPIGRVGDVTVRLNDDGSVSPARDAATENEVQRVTLAVSRVVQQASQQILDTNSDGVGLHNPLKQQPLPRFTADELDDVDHSKTTKLDEVTLRRGKMPTVEQITKYREVRAKRLGGTVADALKESRIDCEVAQYVLERWAGGLDNTAAHKLIAWVVETTDVGLGLFVCSAEARAQQWIDHHSPTLDTSEKPSLTVQRERQEAEERRQRLAELRQRLAAERAAQPQEMAKEADVVSRFDLIEPDPQADPAASIRAWEARQAAAKVRPAAVPAKPAAAPRRPAIEVVDADVDGLSRVEVVTALFGRALNGGC